MSEEVVSQRRHVLSGRGTWPRYSAYEIVKTEHSVYVAPKPGARLEFYRPFDHYPQILVDFLSMAKELAAASEDPFPPDFVSRDLWSAARKSKLQKVAEEAVLPFVGRYGLLGLYSYFIVDWVWECQRWDEEAGECKEWGVSLTLSGEWWGPNKMRYSEYARWFYPEDAIPRFNPDLFHHSVLERQRESVDNIMAATSWLYRQYSIWSEFSTAKSQPHPDEFWDEQREIPWSARLEQIAVPAQVGIVFRNGRPEMDWRFTSLLEALGIMLVENITVADHPVRTCLVCGTPFIPSRSDSWGCSPAHRNTIRTWRHRGKLPRSDAGNNQQ